MKFKPQEVANMLEPFYTFIARDKCKSWFAYEREPTRGSDEWVGGGECSRFPIEIDYNGDWRDSLFKKQSFSYDTTEKMTRSDINKCLDNIFSQITDSQRLKGLNDAVASQANLINELMSQVNNINKLLGSNKLKEKKPNNLVNYTIRRDKMLHSHEREIYQVIKRLENIEKIKLKERVEELEKLVGSNELIEFKDQVTIRNNATDARMNIMYTRLADLQERVDGLDHDKSSEIKNLENKIERLREDYDTIFAEVKIKHRVIDERLIAVVFSLDRLERDIDLHTCEKETNKDFDRSLYTAEVRTLKEDIKNIKEEIINNYSVLDGRINAITSIMD